MNRYSPKPYPGNMILAAASEMDNLTKSLDLTKGWGELIQGDLVIYRIPGDHTTILQEPGVQLLAKKLTNFCCPGKE